MSKSKTKTVHQNLSAKEVLKQIADKKQALHDQLLDVALGRQKNVSLVRKTKREIAQLLTYLHEMIKTSVQKS